MKAAIIGYGKMGREIERILAERGHETALVIDTDNVSELDAAHLAGIDVAIEFTTPQTVLRQHPHLEHHHQGRKGPVQ